MGRYESVAGSSTCELVQCYAGEELLNGKCYNCDDGKYSSNGITCITCDPGQQPTTDKNGCEMCLPGYYSADGTACVPCGGSGKPIVYGNGVKPATLGTYQDEPGASNCK